jgi:hypothetical protein
MVTILTAHLVGLRMTYDHESTAAWEGVLAGVCGRCGMRPLTQELRVCSLCGATKPADWAERNRTFPLAPGEALPIIETADAPGPKKGQADLATKWLDETRSVPRKR